MEPYCGHSVRFCRGSLSRSLLCFRPAKITETGNFEPVNVVFMIDLSTHSQGGISMKITQISVAIEDSMGKLYEVTRALGDAGVNIRALNLVETVDFGTVRLIVSDIATTLRVLEEMHVPVHLDEVLAVKLDDKPGSLADFLKIISDAKIGVRHMYAIIGSASGKAIMLFHFDDNDRAIEIICEKGLNILTSKDLRIYQPTG